MSRANKYALLGSSIIFCASCSFLEIDVPRTEIVSEAVFNDDATAESALMGIYASMVQNGIADGRVNSLGVINGLYADELQSHLVYLDDFFNNSLSPDNTYLTSGLWGQSYKMIYSINLALEGLESSSSIAEPLKRQLMGEARFLRAFFYFNMLNLFENIPLVLDSDYRVNQSIEQTNPEKVYAQIIEDLTFAESWLEPNYNWSTNERVRPNQWAAKALMARVRLYTENWTEAIKEASAVIGNVEMFGLEDISNVFQKESKEAIWQLKPTEPGRNTWEATFFIPAGNTTTPTTVSILPSFATAFEQGDMRKVMWMESVEIGDQLFFYPFKYKVKDYGEPLAEYQIVLRLAELILIRAEANIRIGNIGDALTDVNAIRLRAGLPALELTSGDEVLKVIREERRFELFAEWGHRFFDLKRWVLSNEVLAKIKPNWKVASNLFPIPYNELQRNRKLFQNPGY